MREGASRRFGITPNAVGSTPTVRDGARTITVSGHGQLALSPGVYVITGRLTLSGGATLTGAGVTLYLTCASYPSPCPDGVPGAGIDLSGNASLALNDGAIGDDTGIVILADPTNHAAITAAGDTTITVSGSIDTPGETLALTGNARLTGVAGRLILDRLTATGNSTLTVTADPDTTSSGSSS